MTEPIRALLETVTRAAADTMLALASTGGPALETPAEDGAAPPIDVAPVQRLPEGGLDYWEVVTTSGPVVFSVLLLLVVASVASWAIIARKGRQLRRARLQSVEFLETFWQSKRLEAIYEAAESLPESPVSQVFKAGYVELTKISKDGPSPRVDDDLESIERAMRRSASAELTHLESQTPYLATVGATAPFVGLFGTVWGIMGAFHEIYQMGSADLATVSKPIAEALIATAIGLFTAIPAVVGYNQFVSRIRILESEMENFSSDFLNIVKRHFFRRTEGAEAGASARPDGAAAERRPA